MSAPLGNVAFRVERIADFGFESLADGGVK